MTRVPSLLAALLVIATVTAGLPASSVAGAEDMYALDTDNPLASADTAAEYEETGSAGGTVDQFDMRLTVTSSHEAAGLDGLQYATGSDSMNHYLRVQYNESIERTIRFYVHEDNWHPHYRQVDAENADVEAQFEPVKANGQQYTAVTLTLTGETDAVFQVPKAVSGYYAARDTGRTWIENTTGFEVPSILSGSTQWERVNPDDLDNQSERVGIEAADRDVMVQYDAGNTSERWVSVPSCENRANEPVCTFTREGDDNVYVLSKVNETPSVRYKHGSDPVAELKASLNELRGVDDWVSDRVDAIGEVFR